MPRVKPIVKLLSRLAGGRKPVNLAQAAEVRARLRGGAKVVSFGAEGGRMKVLFSDEGAPVFLDALKSLPKATTAGVRGDEAKNLLIRQLTRPYVAAKKGSKTRRVFVPGEGEGVLGRAGRVTRQGFSDHPILATAVTAAGAGFIGSEVVDAARGVAFGNERIAQVFDEEMAIRDMLEQAHARNDETALLMEANLQRLAQIDPHLYNELAYGRRFARGEVPIGGQPNNTMLNAVAAAMAQGATG